MTQYRIERALAKCQAYGLCLKTAPGVFALGEDRKVRVIDSEGAGDDIILKAAKGCPYRAIASQARRYFRHRENSKQKRRTTGGSMEHGRFAYSPITQRPKLRLPKGARVAVWITPNVEHFHWGKPAIAMTQMTASLNPDVLNYAWRDYGARVGVWRVMEILNRHRFPATAALNAEVCEHYPQIVEEGNRLGWEWMAHGPSNSMLFTGMPEEVERPIINGVIDTITKATGKKPRGWLGPALTETQNTLDILADAGIEYVGDWCNDELPYAMKTRNGSIIAMPYTLEVGDIPVFVERGGTGEDFYRMIVDQFDVLYKDGGKIPRVLSIAIHPFIIGHPFRAKHLDRALAYIKKHDSVWITTGGAIVDWYKKASAGKKP